MPVSREEFNGPHIEDRLSVLYRDQHLIAVAKPAGLLVHRSRIDYHEQQNLVEALSRQTGRRIYPAHRLDKPTSGVLVAALDEASARQLGKQFENRQVLKTYLAVVRGYTRLVGFIDHPVGDKDRPAQEKRAATTLYRTLSSIELPYRADRYPASRYSLIEVRPQSGRRHQIRQHLKHINHPIIGDTSYGKTSHNRLFANLFECRRLLLHAASITLTHPVTDRMLTINCDLSELPGQDSFPRVLKDTRWRPVPVAGGRNTARI